MVKEKFLNILKYLTLDSTDFSLIDFRFKGLQLLPEKLSELLKKPVAWKICMCHPCSSQTPYARDEHYLCSFIPFTSQLMKLFAICISSFLWLATKEEGLTRMYPSCELKNLGNEEVYAPLGLLNRRSSATCHKPMNVLIYSNATAHVLTNKCVSLQQCHNTNTLTMN